MTQPESGGCKGRDPTIQNGRFVGTFRFHGERGFTTVRANRARGTLHRRFKQVCERPDEERGASREPEAVSLSAYVKGNPAKASFSVYDLRLDSSPDGVDYSASATERRGRITVTRSAIAYAEASTFSVSDPATRPITATVAPPAPFSGRATGTCSPAPRCS